MRGILSFAPLDLVDLLLNFERLKVVEFWFVRLELGVELVFASFFLDIREIRGYRASCDAQRWLFQWREHRGTDHFIPLKQDHSSALVARGEVVSCRVELNGRNDVG